LPQTFAQDHVGVEYSIDEIGAALRAIGCLVAHVDGGFEVTPPTWRPDLTHKTDLVEEIARISGYERIPARLPVAPPGRGLTRAQVQRRKVANALAASGLVEVLNYPFVTDEQLDWVAVTGLDSSATPLAVKLANPLQGQASNMRVSLLPALVEAAARNNSRGLTDLAIYEIGSVFHPVKPVGKNGKLPIGNERPEPKVLASLNATVPAQPKFLAGVFIGDRLSDQVGIKGIPANYADAIQAAKVAAFAVGAELQVRQASPKGFHPGRTAELFVATAEGDQVVGFAGELDPALAVQNHLPRKVGVFEINLDLLGSVAPAVVQAGEVNTYPAATQDLSLLVQSDVPAAEVLAVIRHGAGPLLELVTLTDDYRGQGIADGFKSLTFALRFRAEDRTLTQAEATVARDAAVSLANQRFGATLRA
jgi:phenylalanyl-tRNA synthetase beta chain